MLQKVIYRLRREWRDRYYAARKASYWSQFRGSRVLIHHGVVAENPTAFNARFVRIKDLEAQLIFFKRNFHIATLTDFVERNYPQDRYTLVLTFDDGYKNNLSHVLPLLEKHKVPACFFATSILSAGQDILWADHLDLGFRFSPEKITIDGRDYEKSGRQYIDRDSGTPLKEQCKEEDFAFKQEMMKSVSAGFKDLPELRDYWQLMSAEDLRLLNKSDYAEVGSHGHFHNNYANVKASEAREDMRMSKEYLEEVMQTSVDFLAYPDGSYTREVVALGEELGYQYQFSTGHLFEEDELDDRLRSRLGINPFIGVEHQAKAMIDGHY
ncbi:MAG: polysaccharide deacetylase family protein [Roseivirga sp.]|nr:polysaccharide deacetylase family protein [Roseivirga sp.]